MTCAMCWDCHPELVAAIAGHGSRGQREPEGDLQRAQRTPAAHDRPELVWTELGRLDEETGQRNQDDQRKPGQGQAHGEAETR